MARRAKKDTSVPTHGSNGFDSETVKVFKARVENLMHDLDVERSEYMNACTGLRGDIKLVLDEAKAVGIPKKEFKAVLETCRLANKIVRIREDLEGDSQDAFDLLTIAIGGLSDLPLGQAALRAAAPNGQATAQA